MSLSDEPQKATRANTSQFPQKLRRMINENSNVLNWAEDGKGFVVRDNPVHDIEEVLGKYFRTDAYQSFQRQLNYFDFKKSTIKGLGVGTSSCYTHQHHQQHNPDADQSITRNTGKKRKRDVPDDEPPRLLPLFLWPADDVPLLSGAAAEVVAQAITTDTNVAGGSAVFRTLIDQTMSCDPLIVNRIQEAMKMFKANSSATTKHMLRDLLPGGLRRHTPSKKKTPLLGGM
jgi:hypothetical protein